MEIHRDLAVFVGMLGVAFAVGLDVLAVFIGVAPSVRLESLNRLRLCRFRDRHAGDRR